MTKQLLTSTRAHFTAVTWDPFNLFLLAAQPVSLLTAALFSLILHFILLSSSFLKCQGEHLSSLHHKETQRHLSTRSCVSQMPATLIVKKLLILKLFTQFGEILCTQSPSESLCYRGESRLPFLIQENTKLWSPASWNSKILWVELC